MSDKKRRRSGKYGWCVMPDNNNNCLVSSSPAKTATQSKSAASIIKPAKLAAAPAQEDSAANIIEPARLEAAHVQEEPAGDVVDR